MLDRVSFKNFKSLQDVTIDLSPLTVLVGPNGSGKSSVLEAIHILAQTGLPRPGDPSRRWDHLGGVTFGGSRMPRRIAHPGASSLRFAMHAISGDELVLTITLSANHVGARTPLVFEVEVRGPAGRLRGAHGDAADPAKRGPIVVDNHGSPVVGAGTHILDHPRVRHFASAVYLHLDATLMTRTSTTDEELPRMAADGEGLASTLAWLAGAKPDTLAAIAGDLAQVVPGVKRILVHRERIVDRVMEKVDIDGQPIWRPVDRPRIGDRFSIEFTNGTEVPADLLSEGTVLALGLLTKLREPDRPRLFLLDDIDRGLHIEAQARLVAALRELMRREPDLQIVCSTHSTYLLNLFKPEEVRVLALDADRATHARPLSDHPEFATWKYGTQTGELWAALGDAWVVARDKP